jgi:hypothetical protein
MNELAHSDCCREIFGRFQFQNLPDARPPNKKGVYAIRFTLRGKGSSEIVAQVKQLVDTLGWPQVGEFVLGRVRRIERIGQCPIIYIGGAGSGSDSKSTLSHRLKEFSNRHTAMYPIWALVYFGWKLEFGWFVAENAGKAEKEIKQLYKQERGGRLPALVEK